MLPTSSGRALSRAHASWAEAPRSDNAPRSFVFRPDTNELSARKRLSYDRVSPTLQGPLEAAPCP